MSDQTVPNLTPEAAAAALQFIQRAQYHPTEFQTFQQVSAALRNIAAAGVQRPQPQAAPSEPEAKAKPKPRRKAAAKG